MENKSEEFKIEFQELENLIHEKTLSRLKSDAEKLRKGVKSQFPTLFHDLHEKTEEFVFGELKKIGLDYKWSHHGGRYEFSENENLRTSEIYKNEKQRQFNDFVRKLEEKEREAKAEKVIDEILGTHIPSKPDFPENSIIKENEVQKDSQNSFLQIIKNIFTKWKNRDRSRTEIWDIGGGSKKKVYYNSQGKEYFPEPTAGPPPPIPPKPPEDRYRGSN